MPSDNKSNGELPFDANEFLRRLEKITQSKSIETGTSDPLGRVGKSALWSILIPIIIIVGIAVVAWLSRGSQRELARLRHAKFKEEVRRDRSKTLAKHSTNMATIHGMKKAFSRSEDKLRLIEADIAAEEKRHEANIDSLHRTRTWDGSYQRIGR